MPVKKIEGRWQPLSSYGFIMQDATHNADGTGYSTEQGAHDAFREMEYERTIPAVGGAYTVQFEKLGKFFRTSTDSKRDAVKLACATSNMTGGYVVVMHKGLEVASCVLGKEVKRNKKTK